VYNSWAPYATVFNAVYILFIMSVFYLLLIVILLICTFLCTLSSKSIVSPSVNVPPYSLFLAWIILVVYLTRLFVWGDELFLFSTFLSSSEISSSLIEPSSHSAVIAFLDFMLYLFVKIVVLIYSLLCYQLSLPLIYYFYYFLFINVGLFIYFMWLLLLETNPKNYIFVYGVVSHRYFFPCVNLSYSVSVVLIAADFSSATGILPANLFVEHPRPIDLLSGSRGQHLGFSVPASSSDFHAPTIGTLDTSVDFDHLYTIDSHLLSSIANSSVLSSDRNQVILHSILHTSTGLPSTSHAIEDSTSHFLNCEGFHLTSTTRLRPFIAWIELYRTSVPGGRVITVEDLLCSIRISDLRLSSI
jgi:hypothetical protein